MLRGESASMTTRFLGILYLCVSCSGILSLIYCAVRMPKGDGVRPFILFLSSVFIYSIGYMLELSGNSLDEIYFALRVEFFGIPFLAVFWFLFALEYGKHEIKNKALYASLFVVPATTVILLYTNNHHHFYYSSLGVDASGAFPVAIIEKGPWYYVEFFYEQMLSLAGVALFYSMTRKTKGYAKKQARAVFLASIIPWCGNLLGMLGAFPQGIDAAPFYLSISAPVAAIAMFRLRMFNIAPIARAKVFETMRTPVLVLDRNLRIADFNAFASAALPELTREAIGVDAREALSARGELMDNISSLNETPIEVAFDDGGERRHFSVSATTLFSSRNKPLGLIILLYDVTENKRLMDQLRRLASVDPLTQTYNRRSFMESCQAEMRRISRYGGDLPFLLIDIDHFKQVNDTFGHLAGDLVLRSVTSTFRNILRSSDIIGRYGGEEFAIALPETDLEGAKTLAERLRREVKDTAVAHGGEEIRVTISVGIAFCSMPPDGEDIDCKQALGALLRDSDQALYKAKAMGRNQVRWTYSSFADVRPE